MCVQKLCCIKVVLSLYSGEEMPGNWITDKTATPWGSPKDIMETSGEASSLDCQAKHLPGWFPKWCLDLVPGCQKVLLPSYFGEGGGNPILDLTSLSTSPPIHLLISILSRRQVVHIWGAELLICGLWAHPLGKGLNGDKAGEWWRPYGRGRKLFIL